jgi:hypothetical protein
VAAVVSAAATAERFVAEFEEMRLGMNTQQRLALSQE